MCSHDQNAGEKRIGSEYSCPLICVFFLQLLKTAFYLIYKTYFKIINDIHILVGLLFTTFSDSQPTAGGVVLSTTCEYT